MDMLRLMLVHGGALRCRGRSSFPRTQIHTGANTSNLFTCRIGSVCNLHGLGQVVWLFHATTHVDRHLCVLYIRNDVFNVA